MRRAPRSGVVLQWYGSVTGQPVSSEKASENVPPASASYEPWSFAAAFSISGAHSCRRAALRYARHERPLTGKTSSMSTVCHAPARHSRTCEGTVATIATAHGDSAGAGALVVEVEME